MPVSIFEILNERTASALRDVSPTIPSVPGEKEAVETALEQLQNATDQLVQSQNLKDWLDRVRDWRQAFDDVAIAAFGSPDQSGKAIARLLLSQMPRLAAYLSMRRIITNSPEDGAPTIDTDELADVISSPNTLVDEQFWTAILGDDPASGTGRLPAVLVALLIMAPQSIAVIANDNLKIAALPAPSTREPGLWRQFRQASENWLSVTLPIGDPSEESPTPGSLLDLVSGIRPDFAATIAGRANRVGGANPKTDFEFWLALSIDEDRWKYELGNGWVIEVEPGLSFGFGRVAGDWQIAFRNFSAEDPDVPIPPSDPLTATLGRELGEDDPDILLGPPYDSRLEIRDVELYLILRGETPTIEIGARTVGFAAVLTNRWMRIFGASDTLFREGIRVDLDLQLAFIEGQGFLYNLESQLNVLLHFVDATVGNDSINFRLHAIRLTGVFDDTVEHTVTRLELGFHVSAQLSKYVGIVLDGFGGWIGDDGDDNYEVLPPTGGGVQITLPELASGGGYFERKSLEDGGERFAGGFTLQIAKFGVNAFGIFERLGNGEKSFLLVLGVRFIPGIQLGFGFAITGIGGLFGFNRRADTDALRERLTSGAAGNVLFQDDPIKNGPTIIGDLAALFPEANGRHCFGPTAQISWLQLDKKAFAILAVGIVIELPGPSKIVLFGSFRAGVPEKNEDDDTKSVLKLRLDFAGVLDFDKQILEFDATLIQSTVLVEWDITGDAAFRTHWGDQPYGLLSVGGFHPEFDPEPIVVPDLTRVALTQSTGLFEAGFHLRFEAYFAVSTNTIQFGGAAEIGWGLGPFNITGYLAFDALMQFRPFYFSVEVSAGVRLRWRSSTLMGVKLVGRLEGPGPLRLTGRACIEVLWFDICAKGSVSIGRTNRPQVETVGSVVAALSPELDNPANLEVIGNDELVSIAPEEIPGTDVLIPPNGGLVWRQKRAPLNVRLEKLEGSPLRAAQAVIVSSPQETAVSYDWFSPGLFTNLSKSEALNRRAFDRLQAGIELGFSHRDSSDQVAREAETLTIRLPRKPLAAQLLIDHPELLLQAVSGRSGENEARPQPIAVTIKEPSWAVFKRDGTLARDDLRETDAHQHARAGTGVAIPRSDVVKISM